MNLIQFEGCTVAVIAPEDLEAQEADITALRAEVGQRTEEARDARHDKMVAEAERDDAMADLFERDVEVADLRSQLSARDAEVRALRGFAQYVAEAAFAVNPMTGDDCGPVSAKLIESFLKEHGLLGEHGEPTPLLTGEPGPGGDGGKYGAALHQNLTDRAWQAFRDWLDGTPEQWMDRGIRAGRIMR